MNLVLMIAIFLANLIAITVIYQFVKKYDNRNKILFMAISISIIYITVSIIYWISGIGIDKSINEGAKNFTIFLFVPVNTIILIPAVATKYVKYKSKKISKREFFDRLIKVILIGVIVLTAECVYFRHIKKNIKIINTNREQTRSKTLEENTTNSIKQYTINTID